MSFFARRLRRERRVLFSLVYYAGAGGVANFVTTRVRREFIHPLPPAGYSPLSQGESQLQQKTLRKPIVPLRQGRRGAKRRRGWINRSSANLSPLTVKEQFSVFRFHFSVRFSLLRNHLRRLYAQDLVEVVAYDEDDDEGGDEESTEDGECRGEALCYTIDKTVSCPVLQQGVE